MDRRAPLVIASFISCVALAACSAPEPTGEASSPIVGGSDDGGDPAIVMLVSIPPDGMTFDTCTASLIAPDVLLTAAHCVDPSTHPGATFGVFTGPDASAFSTAQKLAPELVKVKSVHVHPDYDPSPPFTADLGVAVLDAPLDLTPLPIARSAPNPSITGTPARIVGYGQTVYNELNLQKHQADTVVASIGADDTLVVGDVKHKSCVGDSGGPALVVMDGVETILGVDSYAETKGCLEPAHYRRTDLYTSFIDPYAPPPPVADAGAGGGSATSAGTGGGAPAESGGCAMAKPSDRGIDGLAAGLIALFAGWARARPRRARVRAGARR